MSVEAQLEAAAEELQAATRAADAVRPDEPSLPLGRWMRKNLFSSVSSTILTIVFAAVSVFAYRGVLNFVFSEERRWDAIRVNLRALFTFAYPQSQYIRIWVTLGVVLR